MARPPKTKFPMHLDTWLRLALPKKRPEDRMKILREWRRFSLEKKLNREPTDQELKDEVKQWQEHEFFDSHNSYNLMYSIREFLPIFHKENLSKRAKAMAAGRWTKKIDKSP